MSSETNPSEKIFDVVIIGAGINGAGIARDAAMRGLSVLLLDKGDIGGGTSSWSTRLIHGGLRYLEHAEFSLVRESLRERETLMKIAPHLVRPLPLLVPIYREARRGPWTMRAGMLLYDLLSFDKTLPRHKMLTRAETLQRVPLLESNGLTGAAVYYDAQVEFAERLVLENVLSAAHHGANVLTYAEVEKLALEDGNINSVELSRKSGKQDHIRARVVINAAGPWVDQITQKGDENSARLIGGTKGSHIIVRPFSGAPQTAIYVEAHTDGRPFFIIPWNSHYLIGTTDIRFNGDPDSMKIEDDEVEYLLRETNRVLPAANLNRPSILYAYSGVRPLPFTEDEDEQSITRRHFIRQHPTIQNLLSVVGGKLTTYRSLAEKTVDLIYRKLGSGSPACSTDRVPLTGSANADFKSFQQEFSRRHDLSALTSNHLLRTYGVSSNSVMKLVSDNAELGNVFDPETGAIAAEVVYAFQYELAVTLVDCMFRRTMVGLNSTLGLESLEAAADVAQKHLGWSIERREAEVAAYRKYVERFRHHHEQDFVSFREA